MNSRIAKKVFRRWVSSPWSIYSPYQFDKILKAIAVMASADRRAARTAARRNPNGGADEAGEARLVRWLRARDPSTPPAELATLATDTDRDVRLRVAWHPNAPPDALATLATDADRGVRRLVARNPITPPEELATLTTDEDADVRKAAARRYQQFADRGRPRPVAAANSDDVRPAPKRT